MSGRRRFGSLFSLSVGALFILRDSKKNTKAAKPSHPVKGMSSTGQGSAGTQEVGAVCFFPVMAVHIVSPHVLLGATGEGPISALGPNGGSCHGAYLLF